MAGGLTFHSILSLPLFFTICVYCLLKKKKIKANASSEPSASLPLNLILLRKYVKTKKIFHKSHDNLTYVIT